MAPSHATTCMSADRFWIGCVPLSEASAVCRAAMEWCSLSSDPDTEDVQPHSTPAGFCEDGNLAIPPGDCCNSQPWISRNCWLVGLLFLLLWIFEYALFCVDDKNMFGPGGWCERSCSCRCRCTLPDSGPKLMLLLWCLPVWMALDWMFSPSCCRAPDEFCFGRIYLKPIRLCPVCDLVDAWQQLGIQFRHFTGVTGGVNLTIIRERVVV